MEKTRSSFSYFLKSNLAFESPNTESSLSYYFVEATFYKKILRKKPKK